MGCKLKGVVIVCLSVGYSGILFNFFKLNSLYERNCLLTSQSTRQFPRSNKKTTRDGVYLNIRYFLHSLGVQLSQTDYYYLLIY